MIIYMITNKVNGKIYIGCTILPIIKRFQSHYWKRNEGNTPIQRAFKKYGKDSFDIVEIDRANTRLELLQKEKYWIAKLKSRHFGVGYNLHEGGACLGRSATIAEKELNRRRNIGKTCSPETRLKISLAQKGIPKSKKSIELARLKLLGRKQTQSHIEKCRLKRFGRIVSEESKMKSSISNTGKKRSEETRLLISAVVHKHHMENKNKLGQHIICVNNNKVYLSHKEAADKLNLDRSRVTDVVNGKWTHTKGYMFQKLNEEHLIF